MRFFVLTLVMLFISFIAGCDQHERKTILVNRKDLDNLALIHNVKSNSNRLQLPFSAVEMIKPVIVSIDRMPYHQTYLCKVFDESGKEYALALIDVFKDVEPLLFEFDANLKPISSIDFFTFKLDDWGNVIYPATLVKVEDLKLNSEHRLIFTDVRKLSSRTKPALSGRFERKPNE